MILFFLISPSMESHCLHLRLQLSSTSIRTTTKRTKLSFISPTKPIHFPCRTPLLHLSSPRSYPLRPIFAASTSDDAANPNSSDDLAPVPSSRRTLTFYDMASLWVGLVVGVPSYYLAGSLVDLGMAWWQGVATVTFANLILLFPLILTAVPGARYGISFPILARSAFGIRGARIPSVLRALVACGWFGIETWIGGEALFLLLPSHLKTSTLCTTVIPLLGTSVIEFACFMVFWAAQLAVVWKGMEGIRKLEKYSAPVLIVLTTTLLCWAYFRAGGFGTMLSLKSRLSSTQFFAVFFPSLTANISFWATLAINIPDFSRYAKSQKDQILGQAGLPLFMGAFSFAGLAITSATEEIFGHVISNPIHLLGKIGGLPTRILGIVGITLATMTTNIAANIVAPANALVDLRPSLFTFQQGALLTAIIGILLQPWRLLRSSESFVYTWLLGYSALLGPIGGIVLADYYLVKNMELDVEGLYSLDPQGQYYHNNGYNPAAMVAMLVGMLPIVPGFLHKVGVLSSTRQIFVTMYNNSWFVSFFISGIIYWLLSLSKK